MFITTAGGGILAASVVGGLLGGSHGGGGGTQTQNQTREPWGPAQPWLLQNINRGQELQNFYQANPFSDSQKAAYKNQFDLSGAYRSMLPQLMAGMNTRTFDRSNPLQRPVMQNFSMPSNLGFSASMPNFQEIAPTTTISNTTNQQSAGNSPSQQKLIQFVNSAISNPLPYATDAGDSIFGSFLNPLKL